MDYGFIGSICSSTDREKKIEYRILGAYFQLKVEENVHFLQIGTLLARITVSR